MRSLTLSVLTLFIASIVCAQSAMSEMNTEKWQEDLAYLSNKIQKTFLSYTPGVKEAFAEDVKLLAAKIPELEHHEIAIAMMAALSKLQDGHTEINVGQTDIGFHRIPFVLKFFEGELYIVNAHESYKALLGGKITQIGKVSTQDAFKRLQGIMSRDNKMEYLHAGPGYLILPEVLDYLDIIDQPMTVNLQIQLIDGSSKEIAFKGLNREKYSKGPWLGLLTEKDVALPLYLQNPRKYYWYEYLEAEQVLYFHFRRVNNQKKEVSIARFTKALFKVVDEKRPVQLIIDFRNNNGGNYHLSNPLIKGIKARPWLNQKGKVWAITGRTTFSASSTTCIFLKQQTETQLIGEPGRTHPNKAQNNEYARLPNSNILVEHTTRIKKHWPELGDLDYIPVDVEITPTFEAYKNGKDEVLDFLFARIKN